MSPFYAGAARLKLDPPAGLAMLGYGNRVGRNNGVHDDLAAQALVLSDGANKIAIVGVDLLAIGARIADDIRDRAAAKTGIPADSILVSATHTHSAPAFNIFATPRDDAKPAEGRDLEWERAIPAKIASAIVQANENLEPATLRTAAAPVHARDQSTLETPAPASSNCRKSCRAGRRRSRRTRRVSHERNSNRVPHELSMPRRGAMRGQPALLARLARLRDGRSRKRGGLRRCSSNLNFHPGRDRQYRSTQPRQFRGRRRTWPRDGPRRARRARSRALDYRLTNRHASESRSDSSSRI